MWPHYVYLHRKADEGTVFYVGKGTSTKRHKGYERAHCSKSRNPRWHRTVAKHGLSVEVIAHFASDECAQEHERYLISQHGRADLGKGPLVNMTDGGDGSFGLVVSDELRKKRSELMKRPRPAQWIENARAARKNGGNGGVVKKGDKLSKSWVDALARAKVGPLNPMFGKTGDAHPTSRKVVNIETGETWPSVSAAATANGIKMQSLHNRLTGHRPNTTPLRLVA